MCIIGRIYNRCKGCVAMPEPSGNPPVPAHAARTSDKIDVPAACATICNEVVPFRPYCDGVVMQMRNVSEYMLVLDLCLVSF